ncbi:IclR family transcriptional regulator C-terminal domain-containing protein, partial [Xanthobacter sp. V3C-3]|uniref:IclR family transcriptional regulator n=1 Tax=Xanthobacter lutulentifluminis TaxID=3119935 RepID=UPI003726C0D0
REPRIEPSDVTSEMTQVVVNDSAPVPAPVSAPGVLQAKEDETITIQSVDRALSILEYIASAREPRRLQDVAAAVGLKAPTCYSQFPGEARLRPAQRPSQILLSRAQARRARPSGERRLRHPARRAQGPRARDRREHRDGKPHPHRLELAVEVEAPGGISFNGYREDVGRACHATALGKAILAWLPEAEIARVVAEHGLLVFTERTIDSLGELIESLRLVRRHGFAIEDGEYRPGVSALALAIRDPWGAVVGSLGCFIPRNSDEMERLRGLHRKVDAAAKAASALFYGGSPKLGSTKTAMRHRADYPT